MRACCCPNDSQRSSSASCATSRLNRCVVGFGSRPASGFRVLISSAAARAVCSWPAASACSAACRQAVNLLPRHIRFLLRRVPLCEPALLDHHQRGFEASRQRRRSNGQIQGLPTIRQLRIVDGRAAGKLLGFGDQRFGVGPRLKLLRPQLDPPFRVVQLRIRRGIFVSCRLVAQRAKLAAQTGERFRRRGWILHPDPLVQPAFESCARPLRLVLAIEACLQCLAGRIRARKAGSVVADVERLPTAIEFDQRGENRAGSGRQRFQLRQYRVRRGRLAGTIRDRFDPLPRQPSHAVILVPGGVRELAQTLRRAYALRGGHSCFRMLGDHARPRPANPRRAVRRWRCGDGPRPAQAVQPPTGSRRCTRRTPAMRWLSRRVVSRQAPGPAPSRARRAPPNRTSVLQAAASASTSTQREAAAARTSGAGSVARRRGEVVGVRWQFRHAEHALRVVGMQVQRGTKQALGDHGELALCPTEGGHDCRWKRDVTQKAEAFPVADPPPHLAPWDGDVSRSTRPTAAGKAARLANALSTTGRGGDAARAQVRT